MVMMVMMMKKMVMVLTSSASRNLGMLRMMERRRAGTMKVAKWSEEEEDTWDQFSINISVSIDIGHCPPSLSLSLFSYRRSCSVCYSGRQGCFLMQGDDLKMLYAMQCLGKSLSWEKTYLKGESHHKKWKLNWLWIEFELLKHLFVFCFRKPFNFTKGSHKMSQTEEICSKRE